MSDFSDEESSVPGQRLKDGIDLNDVRHGKPAEFTIDETESEYHQYAPEETSTYYEQAEVYRNSELCQLEESDEDDGVSDSEGLTSFEKLKKKMINLTPDNGVMKRVLREGMGATIEDFVKMLQTKELEKPEDERRKIEDDDIQIAYHYMAMQEHDTEPFDITYLRDDRPQKAYFNDGFLMGFKIALASMKKKEMAEFLVSPEYAFGAKGSPPRILPNATIRYRIEMVDFWVATELDSYAKMTREEKRNVPVVKLVKLCSYQREEANKLFNNGDYKGANFFYTKAIKLLEDANLKDDADEQLQQKALVKLYLNKAQCARKLERWDHVISFCNKVLYIDQKNYKALYHKAKAKMEFGDFEEARKIVHLAHSAYPNDQCIGKLLYDISRSESNSKQKEKMLYQKMLGTAEVKQKELPSISPDMLKRSKEKIQQFVGSDLTEIKLLSESYTAEELDALARAASELKLDSVPHKNDGRWVSLKISKSRHGYKVS